MKKSDSAIVAVKSANKGASVPAEPMEPRAEPKGNLESQSTRRAQDRESVSHAADRIRQFVQREPQERLTALLHHVTVDTLRWAFFDLKKDVAAGVDRLTPGDFEVVRRKAGVLEQLDDAAALAAILRTKCEAKPGRRRSDSFASLATGKGLDKLEDDMLDKEKAKRMFAAARDEVGDDVYEPLVFGNLDDSQFLGEYCWVVFASGFRYAVVRDKFPAIKAVFRSFDLETLSVMAPVPRDRLPIRNKRKADGFLEGCRIIADEGFDSFKSRLEKRGIDMLESLRGSGR